MEGVTPEEAAWIRQQHAKKPLGACMVQEPRDEEYMRRVRKEIEP